MCFYGEGEFKPFKAVGSQGTSNGGERTSLPVGKALLGTAMAAGLPSTAAASVCTVTPALLRCCNKEQAVSTLWSSPNRVCFSVGCKAWHSASRTGSPSWEVQGPQFKSGLSDSQGQRLFLEDGGRKVIGPYLNLNRVKMYGETASENLFIWRLIKMRDNHGGSVREMAEGENRHIKVVRWLPHVTPTHVPTHTRMCMHRLSTLNICLEHKEKTDSDCTLLPLDR